MVVSDYVVLALPFAVLANVDTSGAGFDAKKNQAIQQLGVGPWPNKTNGSSYSDTGYQASWEVTRAQPGTPGIIVMYSGGNVTDGMKTTSPFATATGAKVVDDANRGLGQRGAVYPNLAWKVEGGASTGEHTGKNLIALLK